jgi:acyl-CoA reductase-like NAD-dependent aldehyde dehydrogenase
MSLPQAPAFLKHQVDEAVAKGGRVLCGGSPVHDGAGKGRFFKPTLVADCTQDMSIMTEESFGPVVAVAPVDSDEHAVALMNDSKYGLTGAVFTKNVDRFNGIASKLQVGTVYMNR